MGDGTVAGDLAAEARLDDVEFYLGDPYPTYARLRNEAPVFWCESGQFWALSKYEDVVWAELQPNPPFTTTQGLYITEANNPERIAARDPGDAQAMGIGFMSDPPDHTAFRRLVGKAFTPGRLSGLEPSIKVIADELLDALPRNEPVDFVEAVSVPIALRVIAEFLGTSQDDWPDMRRWADSFMAFLGGGIAEGTPEADVAMGHILEMAGFFVENLNDRKANPRDDLMTAVVNLEQDGEPLSEDSQVAICLSVLAAGNETTRNTLSGSMVTFTQHPDQWKALLADPSLSRTATDELLRWVCPVTHFGRRATEALEIRGQKIAAGEFVVMLYGAANRDEDTWENAGVFDVTRPTEPRHLSFGWGLHHCIGAALGRSQVRLVLEGLIERFAGWEIAGEIVRNPSVLVHDYLHVPVSLSPR